MNGAAEQLSTHALELVLLRDAEQSGSAGQQEGYMRMLTDPVAETSPLPYIDCAVSHAHAVPHELALHACLQLGQICFF